MEILLKVLAAVGGLAGIVGAAGWVAQKLLEHGLTARHDVKMKEMEARLEREMKHLENEMGRSRDALNADLRVQAFVRETRFAGLAGRQIEATEELYQRLWEMQAAAHDLTVLIRLGGGSPREIKAASHEHNAIIQIPNGTVDHDEEAQKAKRWERYWGAKNELGTFIRKRGLYVYPSMIEEIERYHKLVNGALIDWDFAARYPQSFPAGQWLAATKVISGDADILLTGMIRRMQKTLGMEEETPAQLPAPEAPAQLPAPEKTDELPGANDVVAEPRALPGKS